MMELASGAVEVLCCQRSPVLLPVRIHPSSSAVSTIVSNILFKNQSEWFLDVLFRRSGRIPVIVLVEKLGWEFRPVRVAEFWRTVQTEECPTDAPETFDAEEVEPGHNVDEHLLGKLQEWTAGLIVEGSGNQGVHIGHKGVAETPAWVCGHHASGPGCRWYEGWRR